MFETILIQPLYNALVWLVTILPGGSIALAVIILTIIVKLILAPLAYKATISQIEQKKLQPKLKEIKELYPDKQEQSQKIIELYKEHKTNPFSGCLVILIQLPIIIGLYTVFLRGINYNPDLVYSFLNFPSIINEHFLSIMLTDKSLIIGLITGAVQFLQIHFSPTFRKTKEEQELQKNLKKGDGPDPEAMANMLQKNMKFVLPIMIAIFAARFPAALALYWIVSILFTMVQEWIIQRKLANK